MKKEYKIGQRVYRLPPCSPFDVKGMECWLGDMALEGFFLVKDGFFAGIAAFEFNEPQTAKYRLQAAQKSTSIWAENEDDPDPEQIELSQKYSWNYIAKRGDFYIYRSFNPDAREMNTDPEVEALALNSVKKKRFGSLLGLLFWIVIYLFILTRGGVLLTIISIKTWLFLILAMLALWVAADELAAFLSLGKLQKKLWHGENIAVKRDWKKSAFWHNGKKAFKTTLEIILICLFLHNWSVETLDRGFVPIDQYTGELPFATLIDFAGARNSDYSLTLTDLGSRFNTVKEKSDWLAPRCIKYNEHAQITLSGGNSWSGSLYVDYFEASSNGIANRLAKELQHDDHRKKRNEPIEIPELNVDFAAAYYNDIDFPTIVIQKGNIAVRAFFYQTTSDDTLPIEEWASILADSLG